MNFIIENNILKSTETYIDTKHNLGKIVYDILNENPNHVSQIEPETGKRTTFAEMKNYSVKCALWMKEQGIKDDDIIVVCCDHQPDAYVPVLATFFLDAIFSGWSSDIAIYPARRLMKQFAPRIIFTSAKAAEALIEASKLEDVNTKIVVFENFSDLQTLSGILHDQKINNIDNFRPRNKKYSDSLVAIMLSSGSTGFPKGVMISSRALVSRLIQPIISSTTTLKFIYYSTFSWISGLYFLLHSIYSKYTRILPPNFSTEFYYNIDKCFNIIEKLKIDYIAMPPSFVNVLAKSDTLLQKYNLKSLKFIYISGSKVSKPNLEALKRKCPNASILRVYGMTEALRVFETNDKIKHVESVGFISSYCQAKFVDLMTGKTVGPNQRGEIRIKAPSVMIGYFKNIEATKESFDEEGWLRSGDIGYYNETGEIFLYERMKELLKYNCYQVSPLEVEEVLLAHPDVQEAAVVGILHEIDGDWPIAFVEKTLESKVTEEELIEFTSSILEDYKRLRGGIRFMNKLPRTESGKIAKNELKRLANNLTETNNK